MKDWRGIFEIVRFPIEVVFIGMLLLGIGNLLTNSVFGIVYLIENDIVKMIAEVLYKTGQFLIVNFPLLFLIRWVTRKNGSTITVISVIAGYITFLVTTMLFTRTDLSSTAFYSTFGISLSKSSVSSLTGTRYPLQTGLLGSFAISFVTLLAYNQSRKRNEYGFFTFVSKESVCIIRTIFYSFLVGIVFSYVWPYLVLFTNQIISFISVDTTNPVNLSLYGILDRLYSTFNLGSLIRTPFWYNANGGSWIGLTGNVAQGDVNVWTAQVFSSSITGQAGRFITPYYILNIFAIPGMIWGMYSMQKNPFQKGRSRLVCIIATLISLVSGSLLPMELVLLFLSPVLYLLHLGCTGILYALLQILHIYLGYNNSDTLTVSALPGTLPEFIAYCTNPDLQMTIIYIATIGVVTAFLYFFMTRFYFKHMAVDIFRTGDLKRITEGTLKAFGGIENIKATSSDCFILYVTLYDATKLDTDRLKRLGASKVVETRMGYEIYYGGSSTMIQKQLEQTRRDSVREV